MISARGGRDVPKGPNCFARQKTAAAQDGQKRYPEESELWFRWAIQPFRRVSSEIQSFFRGFVVLTGQTTMRRAIELRGPRRARRRERLGTATVEFAVLLPLVMTLMLGTWEIGRLVEVEQILNNAAREAGRRAASGQYTNAQVQQIALNYLSMAGLTTTNAAVTVTDLTHAGTDATAATELDQLQITVTIPFVNVRWASATLVTSASTVLSATNIWLSNNGQSYPSNITVPAGY
jgi:Flp pilus assembly protein TadG